MSTRHIATPTTRPRDLTPEGSGGGALRRFRRRLASDGFAVDDGWRPKPGYLYTVVRAISARVNQNYDGWPSDELKRAYKTFIGKPCFVNHENHDPTKARGVIVAARYAENGPDKYIETVMEIDAKRFPKLAHEIQSGGLDSVSMGAEAGFTICSYCHNKATDLHDMCDHVQLHKGKTLSRLDKKTGKREEVLVFESCHKISFFELSYVFEPADETAVASKVVVAGLHKHAGECPPGMDCSRGMQGLEQITRTSPNNPVNQVSTDAVGGGGGTAGSSPSGFDPKQWASADDYAKSMNGKPYEYGGGHGGPSNSVDCSGFMSNLYSIYSGKPTAFSTNSDFAALGFQPGYKPGAFNIGTNGGVGENGHMAGTLPDGTNVESNGSNGVQYGGSAVGATDGQFSQQWHYPVANTPTPGTTPAATTAQPTTRAAGKYTKDDFAIADGKKPWERDKPAPAPEEAADLKEIEAMMRVAMPFIPENTGRTQRPGTMGTYIKAHDYFDRMGAPGDGVLDYGAGLGHSAQFGDTYEPNPKNGFEPTWRSADDVPPGAHHRVTCLNVLNVVPPEDRRTIVEGVGRALAPGGHAIITTRGYNDINNTANAQPAEDEYNDPGAVRVNPGTPHETYQKPFSRPELAEYVQGVLGHGYSVSPVSIGPAGVHVVKHDRPIVSRRLVRNAALKKIARTRAQKLAWGEQEAPTLVNTLREEGSSPEDENSDNERYVDPVDNPFENSIQSPAELQTPDLSQDSRIDREQEMDQAGPDQGGDPAAGADQDQGNFITLKIPMPQPQAPQPPAPAAPPVPPMAPPAAPQAPPAPPQGQQPPPVTAAVLDYFDNYYGRRVANWLDAIEANRDFTPAEAADYRRQTEKLSTLENGRELSTTDRYTSKGTANMARSSIATRGKVATAGRRQHFAEGPLVDGGPYGTTNDQGEQEEAFITQTPAPEAVDAPADDATNISNTEHNLVARVQRGRDQLLRDAQQLANLRQRRAFDEAGGPVATVVDPSVSTGPGGEELTGTDFESANPNEGVVPTQPKDASLRAFKAFDGWLAQKTGKSSRNTDEATIKAAAAQFSREAGISPQALFPALGVVLREARKNKQANTKGAKMRKRADEKLEVAAPDGRVDVEAPVSNTTDAEAQASQFDIHDFGNNAGDNVANPDLSTDQNWAPGEASKTSARVKVAGGLLAMRCAEGMIEAGLEPNSRERKYQLAAEFEGMNRGLILDRVALLERFAAVRQAERSKVASGSSRGAARSPIPAGLGGGLRSASVPSQRTAAHDPSNDSGLFV